MFPGAGFYGIKEIFLGYAKLPKFLPFPVAVQHGWQQFAHSFEASARPPEIWVWSERLAAENERFYPKNKIRIIGSCFCYLMASFRNELPTCEKQGSVCIPPHSAHFVKTEYPVEEFARVLDQLGDELKPITVMLYYLDMDDHTVRAYEKYGFKVVSNGSLFDVDFLKRFILHVYDKKHCIFSDLGSGVFYASYLGLNLVHIDIQSRVFKLAVRYNTEDMVPEVGEFNEKFLASWNENTTNEELGKNHMLSAKELRRAILRNYATWSFLRRSVLQVGVRVLRWFGLFRPAVK